MLKFDQIPFAIELGNNTIIKSDKNGICRILSLPEENELPYLFNGFWRGSNASGIAGSGLGLFEAREIARKLYGDIYVKTDRERGEIEFDVYLPDGTTGRGDI